MITSSDEESRCGHIGTGNKTILLDINPYGGIPSNVLINIMGFTILILIFLILHKKAYKSVNNIVRKEYLQKKFSSSVSCLTLAKQDVSTRHNNDEGCYIFIIPTI